MPGTLLTEAEIDELTESGKFDARAKDVASTDAKAALSLHPASGSSILELVAQIYNHAKITLQLTAALLPLRPRAARSMERHPYEARPRGHDWEP